MRKIILFFIISLFSFSPICFGLLNNYTVNSGTWNPSNPQVGLKYYGDDRYSLNLTATSNASGVASITINDLGLLDMAGQSTIVVIPNNLNISDIGCDEWKAQWRSGRGWHIERMY